MRSFRADELAQLFRGELHADPAVTVCGFATDSRKVAPGNLFIAIAGEQVDGHLFAQKAVQNGAPLVLAERTVEVPHILVKSVVDALAAFGSSLRSRFKGKVIGITGSAGKTTTKEFAAAALKPLGAVIKSEGNQNTEYTSPLLWANVEESTSSVVVEMAMRGFGQIDHLAKIAKPQIGVVTNIGHSHLELLGSREGIARAKGELLQNLPPDGVAVLWHEDPFLAQLKSLNRSGKTLTFGYSAGADVRIETYRVESWTSCVISGSSSDGRWEARLQGAGRHVALDAAAALLVAIEAGVKPQEAADEISKVVLPPMRMEVRNYHGAIILLDTYNASPASMLAAIETLEELPAAGKRYAILGDMRELGEASSEGHRQVGRAVAAANIDEIFFVGESMREARDQVSGTRASHSADSSHARALIEKLEEGDVLLVKGSRALELERLVQ